MKGDQIGTAIVIIVVLILAFMAYRDKFKVTPKASMVVQRNRELAAYINQT